MVRLQGFQKLMPVTEALDKFLARLQPKRLDTNLLPVQRALERITAENITATRDSPLFDRSAVDGYALKASDTIDTSQSEPKVLRLVKRDDIEDGEAKEIWTGNPLPKSADAVLMLEHAKRTEQEISVFTPLAPGANFSRQGEDVRKGQIALKAGTRLKPHHLGLVAGLGIREIEVVRKPKVAILPTGNELVPLENDFHSRAHNIIDVNSIILSSMCTELGAEAFSLGIVKDDEKEIEEKIMEGIRKADLLITTGGTSVGFHDLVPEVLERIETNSVVAHGIAMRPGMPTALAVYKGKPVIACSGNPVAAIIGFEVFSRPLLQILMGTKEARHKIRARLLRRVTGVLGRMVFLRVRTYEKEGEYWAEPTRVKGSGILTTMTTSNGYVIIPEDREGLKEDELVEVHMFGTLS
ncbi:MAG: molybdopterin molybdotransferase MoeA [Candidatus Bathyarchaeota archaeon]|nr:molybdopterin molybdotransferase MoeA [Candidatus Bathyarchaeota archaeon]